MPFKHAVFDTHADAVWDLCAHPDAPLLFSASSDGSVFTWNVSFMCSVVVDVPQHAPPPYRNPPLFIDVFVFFVITQLSSDQKSPVVQRLTHKDQHIPTSLAVMQTDSAKLLVGYTSGDIALVDIETSKKIFVTPSSTDKAEFTYILDVVSHPIVPLGICANADKTIRFFDLKTVCTLYCLHIVLLFFCVCYFVCYILVFFVCVNVVFVHRGNS